MILIIALPENPNEGRWRWPDALGNPGGILRQIMARKRDRLNKKPCVG